MNKMMMMMTMMMMMMVMMMIIIIIILMMMMMVMMRQMILGLTPDPFSSNLEFDRNPLTRGPPRHGLMARRVTNWKPSPTGTGGSL